MHHRMLRRVRISRAIYVLAIGQAIIACSDSTTTTGPPPLLVDTRLIAFVSDSGNSSGSSIFVMHADGTHKTRVTGDNHRDDSPAWSPNGSTIAFTSDRSPQGIWVVDADGNNLRPLVTAPDFLDPGEPAWSPDGHSIAFSSALRDSLGNFIGVIMFADADGSHARQLTTTATDVGAPAWSPDGTRILFVNSPDGISPHVFVIRTDGTSQQQLTNSLDFQPRWSPNGRLIAFTNLEPLDNTILAHITVMQPDGANRRVLARGGVNRRPAWSPDAQQIAYDGYTRDSTSGAFLTYTRIFRMNANGSDLRPMTSDGGQFHPAFRSWAPVWKPTP